MQPLYDYIEENYVYESIFRYGGNFEDCDEPYTAAYVKYDSYYLDSNEKKVLDEIINYIQNVVNKEKYERKKERQEKWHEKIDNAKNTVSGWKQGIDNKMTQWSAHRDERHAEKKADRNKRWEEMSSFLYFLGKHIDLYKAGKWTVKKVTSGINGIGKASVKAVKNIKNDYRVQAQLKSLQDWMHWVLSNIGKTRDTHPVIQVDSISYKYRNSPVSVVKKLFFDDIYDGVKKIVDDCVYAEYITVEKDDEKNTIKITFSPRYNHQEIVPGFIYRLNM